MSSLPAAQVAAPPADSGTSSPEPVAAGEAFWTSLEEDLRELVGTRYGGRSDPDQGGPQWVDVGEKRYRGRTMREAFLAAIAAERGGRHG